MSNAIVASVARLIQQVRYFQVDCERYRILGVCIEKYATKLEGCWCHDHIWLGSGGFNRKRQRFTRETGHRRCVWKGRMGPWWIAVGVALMFAELERCSSDRFDEWISQLSPADAAPLLRRLQLMRSRLIETLKAKL